MTVNRRTPADVIEALSARLAEAEETLRAIRAGEVDAVVVNHGRGEEVYTLRTAEQPYRHLVEIMQQGAAMLTVDRDVLYCNRHFADLVGLPIERVVGASLDRFFDEEDRAALASMIQTGQGRRHGQLRTADDRLIDVLLSLTTDVRDDVRQCNLIVTDLTELLDARASRRRAERENQAKDEFIAMLAHELRNPLNAIVSAANVLEITGGGDTPVVRARAVIQRQARHLSRLVDDLLETGRLLSGKVVLDRHPLDFAELLVRAVEGFTASPAGPHLEVSTESVFVLGDPVRLEQIVTNVVGNALKYTPAGGRVRITLSAQPEAAELRVEDTGVGIAPDLLPRVFDPFVQGEHTLDRAKGGLGIGLTVVRELVMLHGGVVTAASGGVGRGSQFVIRIPRTTARPADPPPAPSLNAVSRRVLIVEDNADARESFRAMLELVGHEVIEAEDGVRGLERLRTAVPDVAIIDIGLPGLNGYEVARRFRSERPDHPVLLVALTGYSLPQARETSRAAGFDQHLVKPVSLEMLQRLLSPVT